MKKLMALVAVSVLGSVGAEAQTCDQTLSVGADVAAAVAGAADGSTVCLNDGDYGYVEFNDIQRTGFVTLRSATGVGAQIAPRPWNSSFIRFESLTIAWSAVMQTTSHHIEYVDSVFAPNGDGLTFNMGTDTPSASDQAFVVDGCTFDQVSHGLWDGRISVRGVRGLTVKNSVISGSPTEPVNTSDGIMLIGGSTDIRIGPGNVFTNIRQQDAWDGEHVDAIQIFGAGPNNIIFENYFSNGDTFIMAPDGSTNVTVENNVFDGAALPYLDKIQFGATSSPIFWHNTIRDVRVSFDSKPADPASSDVVAENNVMVGNSSFDTSGGNGCVNCLFHYNLFDDSGDARGTDNVIGTPTFVGGANPTTYEGWALADGSLGENAGNDGEDMGIIPALPTAPGCLQMSAYASPQAAVDATPVDGCLEADGRFTLTDGINLNKAMTLQCVQPDSGFVATSGAFGFLLHLQASGLRVNGCALEGPGSASDSIGAARLEGSISDVRLSGLAIRDVRVGVVSTFAEDVQNDIWLTDSVCENAWGTCVGFYLTTESYDIHIARNTFRNTQRGGQAGNAAIQTAGGLANPTLRHHNWEVVDNTVENLTCGLGDQVGIGLDQITDSIIDHNIVRHCNGPGEGIVVVGPRNQIAFNEVYGVGNGAITMISYPGAAHHVQDVTVADNTIVGADLGTGQGIALSFPLNGDPMTGLQLLRNSISQHNWGIQAYSFNGGTIHPGSNNRILNNELSGNINGPCSIPQIVYGSIDNIPSCGVETPQVTPGETMLTFDHDGLNTDNYQLCAIMNTVAVCAAVPSASFVLPDTWGPGVYDFYIKAIGSGGEVNGPLAVFEVVEPPPPSTPSAPRVVP